MPSTPTPSPAGYRRYAWLVALAATVGVYLAVRHGAPLMVEPDAAMPLGLRIPDMAWIFALPFALLTIHALGRVVVDRYRFKRRVREASLEDLDWLGFERLIRDVFKHEGFSLVETPRQAQGGIDYLLARGSERWLMLCRHWQARRVGTGVVQQLAGAVASRQAEGGVIVTRGRFTPPAQALAAKSGIRLVDGAVLAGERLARPPDSSGEADRDAAAGQAPPACPACGGDMIKRQGSSGSRHEAAFWGCARFPDCEGTVPAE